MLPTFLKKKGGDIYETRKKFLKSNNYHTSNSSFFTDK